MQAERQKVLDCLTPDDLRVLMESEDEVDPVIIDHWCRITTSCVLGSTSCPGVDLSSVFSLLQLPRGIENSLKLRWVYL